MLNKLRQARMQKGFTQLELAARTGISTVVISELENQKRIAYPSWRKRLADVLSVQEDELFPQVIRVTEKNERKRRHGCI